MADIILEVGTDKKQIADEAKKVSEVFSDSFVSTSIDKYNVSDRTLYERQSITAVKNIVDWLNSKDISTSIPQKANSLYNELFSGFNFSSTEKAQVTKAIVSKINELLDFNGSHYHYAINKKDSLYGTLANLGGFGTLTESQARDIFRNKAASQMAQTRGYKNLDAVPIYELSKNFQRIAYGNTIIDVPAYTNQKTLKQLENFNNIRFNPRSIPKNIANEQRLEMLFQQRNKILQAALDGDTAYGFHPLASKSGNGKYEINPGAKTIFENRLRELGYGLLEIQIGEIAKKINNPDIVDKIFNTTSQWLDDGRGHFYNITDLGQRFQNFNGNDGKYHVAPSYARTLFHNEVAKYYGLSDDEINKINFADYAKMIPLINFDKWSGRENIFHQDLYALTKYGAQQGEYKELFDGVDLTKLQTFFTALSYFTSGTGNGGWKNFIAAVQDYNNGLDENGVFKGTDAKIRELKANLNPFANFFGVGADLPKEILEIVANFKDMDLITGQKAGSKRQSEATYRLMSEIVNVWKSRGAGYEFNSLSSLQDGKLNGMFVLPVLDSIPEKLFTSYSQRANYKNSKTTSNMHNLFTRQLVYDNTDQLVSAIPYHFLGEDRGQSELISLIQGVLAHQMSKLAQGDFSAAYAMNNKDIIAATDTVFNNILSDNDSSQRALLRDIQMQLSKAIVLSEQIETIGREAQKHSNALGAHKGTSKRLINDAKVRLKNGEGFESLSDVQIALLKDELLANNKQRGQYGKIRLLSEIKKMAMQEDVANYKKYSHIGKRDDDEKRLLSLETVRFHTTMKELYQSAKNEAINQYQDSLGFSNDGTGMKFNARVDEILSEYLKKKFTNRENIVADIFKRFKEDDRLKTAYANREEINKSIKDKSPDPVKKRTIRIPASVSSSGTPQAPTRLVLNSEYESALLRANRARDVGNEVLADVQAQKNELKMLDLTALEIDTLEKKLTQAINDIKSAKLRPEQSQTTTLNALKESGKLAKDLADNLKIAFNRGKIEDSALRAKEIDFSFFGRLTPAGQKQYMDFRKQFAQSLQAEFSKSSDNRDYGTIEGLTKQFFENVGSLVGNSSDVSGKYKKWGIIAKANNALKSVNQMRGSDNSLNFATVDNELINTLVQTVESLVYGLSTESMSAADEQTAINNLKAAVPLLNTLVKDEDYHRRKTSAEFKTQQDAEAATLINKFYTAINGESWQRIENSSGPLTKTAADTVRAKNAVDDIIKQILELTKKEARSEEESSKLAELIEQFKIQQANFKSFLALFGAESSPSLAAQQIIERAAINAKADTAIVGFDEIESALGRAGYLTDSSSALTSEQKADATEKLNEAKALYSKLKEDILKNTGGLLNDSIEADTKLLEDLLKTLRRFLGIGQANQGAAKDKVELDKIATDIKSYLADNTGIFKNVELTSKFLDLQNQISSIGIVSNEAKTHLKSLKNEARRLGLETNSAFTQLGHLIKQHFSTFVAMRIIHGMRNSIRKTFNDILQIDSAMTELKKVTDNTQTAYDNFFDSATAKARQFGVVITDVINATAEFAKLGYDLPDAQMMADAALVYKNVGDGIKDIQTASQSIISTIKAFDIPVKDTMHVVDVFNKIGNEFSITSAGTGEALEKSASALAQAGNTLSESVALIATANTTLQNPSVVGNALKTISLRLTKTKTELEALGEDTDYHVGTSSSYRNEILGLTGNKVDIMEADGSTYKSTYQILKELSEVWDDISNKNQSALLYDLGGARQANALAAILNNFEIAEKAFDAAENASGSALKENEKYLESIAGQMSITKSILQEYSTQLLDDDLVKGVLKIANAFAELAVNITGVSTAWAPLMGLWAFSMQKSDKLDVESLITEAMTWGAAGWSSIKNHSFKDFVGSSKDSLIAAFSNGRSTVADRKAYGNTAALFKQLSRAGSGDEARAIAKQLKDNVFGVKNDNGWYDSRVRSVVGTVDESGKLLDDIDVIRKRAENAGEAFDGLAQGFGSLANAFTASLKAIAATIAVTAVIKVLFSIGDAIIETTDEAQEALDATRNKIQSVEDEIRQWHELEKANNGLTAQEQARLDYLDDYKARLLEIEKIELRRLYEAEYESGWTKLINFFTGKGNESNEADEWLNKEDDGGYTQRDHLYATMESYQNADENYKHLNPEQRNLHMNNIETYIGDEYEKAVYMLEALERENASLDRYMESGALNPKQEEEARKKYSKNQKSIEEYKKVVEDIRNLGIPELAINIQDPDELYDFANAYSFTAESIQKAHDIATSSSQLDDMQNAYKTLADAVADYNKDGAYSLDTLQALVATDSRYLKYLELKGNQLKIDTAGTNDLTNAMILQMRISIAENTLSQMKTIAALDETEAREELKIATESLSGALAGKLDLMTREIELMMAQELGQNGVTAKYQLMEQALKTHNNLMLSVNDITNQNTQIMEDQQKALEDNLRLRGNVFIDVIDKRIEALQDEKDAINDVYEAEDRELELQKRKNAYMAAQANKTVRLYTHDKGWQWVADPTKVKEAKEEYEDYLREVEKEEAIKAIDDQIEKYEDLKDAVRDAMDHIGETLDEHNLEMQLTAEFEAMAFEQMKVAAADYEARVIGSLKNVEQQRKQTLRTLNNVRTQDGTIDTSAIDRARSQAILNSYTAEDAMNGELAYYDTNTRWSQGYKKLTVYGAQVRHKGGLITDVPPIANVSSQFMVYMNKLKSNEVPAILEAGEYVLTKDMQKDILTDNQIMHGALMNRSGASNSLSIGDIIINQPVGDANALSRAIITQLPNRILQDIYNS